MSALTISVVIPTFQRPAACERALQSVLEQTEPPLEVVICDDGSQDDTAEVFRAREREDERVRYLRLAKNTGAPAAARNLGISNSRGDLLAFLDDDDEWLPDKLARQVAVLNDRSLDIVATNAIRRNGAEYFPSPPALWEPTRRDVLRANPIVVSSALVRRRFAGFPTDRKLKGIEDYAAWLQALDAGAQFGVLGEPLVRYEDADVERMSSARTQMQLAVARLAWRRALTASQRKGNLRAALRHTAIWAHVAVSDSALGTRLRSAGQIEDAARPVGRR